jgi:hypothetical protein
MGDRAVKGVGEGSIADSRLTGMPLDDQTARQLRTAASNVRTWTEKRNALIRDAHLAGAGIRDIARATGLNVGTIHTMIYGRKR